MQTTTQPVLAVELHAISLISKSSRSFSQAEKPVAHAICNPDMQKYCPCGATPSSLFQVACRSGRALPQLMGMLSRILLARHTQLTAKKESHHIHEIIFATRQVRSQGASAGFSAADLRPSYPFQRADGTALWDVCAKAVSQPPRAQGKSTTAQRIRSVPLEIHWQRQDGSSGLWLGAGVGSGAGSGAATRFPGALGVPQPSRPATRHGRRGHSPQSPDLPRTFDQTHRQRRHGLTRALANGWRQSGGPGPQQNQ